ncbi:MAG: hypothetical protein QXZ09_08675 [Candidatus Methanomethylicaceae archaeon]
MAARMPYRYSPQFVSQQVGPPAPSPEASVSATTAPPPDQSQQQPAPDQTQQQPAPDQTQQQPPPQVDPVEEAVRAANMVLTAAYGSADQAIATLANEGLQRLRALNEWAVAGIRARETDMARYTRESAAQLARIQQASGLEADLAEAGAPRELQRATTQAMLAEKAAALERAGGTVEQSYAAHLGRIRGSLPAALAQAQVLAEKSAQERAAAAAAGGAALDPETRKKLEENARIEAEMQNRALKRQLEIDDASRELRGTYGHDRYVKAGELKDRLGLNPQEFAQILVQIGEPQNIVIDWLKRYYGMNDEQAQGVYNAVTGGR